MEDGEYFNADDFVKDMNLNKGYNLLSVMVVDSELSVIKQFVNGGLSDGE